MTYDHPTRYLTADDQYFMLLGSQHQQNPVWDHAGYLYCDETVTQHPILPIPPSSGSSELGNALVEISPTEPQPMSRASIALAPKHDPSSSLHHRKHTDELFRLVQDPTAHLGFFSSAKVRSTCSSIYRGTS